MVATTPLREVKLVLPMAPDMELVASQAASALAVWVGMTADRVDEVRMAVVEACINAFEHSHAEERKVDITFRVFGAAAPERLEIVVHDRGVGFSPDDVESSSATTHEVVETPAGRFRCTVVRHEASFLFSKTRLTWACAEDPLPLTRLVLMEWSGTGMDYVEELVALGEEGAAPSLALPE